MSHTLDDIRREYDRLDTLCGVDTRAVALRVSTRASKRLGSCKYVGNAVECVTISDFVMAAADDVFYDTIRHEYAHALVKLRRPREKHGHDAVWKAACREVGCAPERCCDPSLLPNAGNRRAEAYHYRLRCLGCGASWDYKRKAKVLRLVERGASRYCTCPHCKGHRFAIENL
ncbi:MAG: SprT-like domain-containing protein [Oscillospiraceae bacterium]|nr:SprT-like domain-containing protein [Oscillospiraceae bacterium]MBQ9721291.1 SprT-like domain-containing protein [Oscillospiraceae bacterium]